MDAGEERGEDHGVFDCLAGAGGLPGGGGLVEEMDGVGMGVYLPRLHCVRGVSEDCGVVEVVC